VGADRAQIEEAPNVPRVIMGVARAAHLVHPMIAAEDPGVTAPTEVLTILFAAQEWRSLNGISVRRRGVHNGAAWLVGGPTTRASILEVLVHNLMRPAPLRREMTTSGNAMNRRIGRVALTGKEPQARHLNLMPPTLKTFPKRSVSGYCEELPKQGNIS